MITIHLKYEIDAEKLDDFEEYGRRWVRLVNRFGGTHHGYFLPSEGDSDIAYALFSFPSLAAYEQYRSDSMSDPECQEAFALARETRCIKRYERRFLRPLDGPPVVGVGEGQAQAQG
ncbi:NIPSNAP family protein [Streptomyces cyaneofuscatus]|uniref:NIPSNAP family protein n=1 Tax=Streptomyces cyaneofuscatus TaxID=66883 RepID=UPI00051739A9|nr:NIPSNAP family protein [Streptomyces cyaneofuscatus]